jgi:ATP-binding cassette subfamily B (MDR/TAP) protein 1
LQAFTLALSACSKIYETIDRVPTIDVYSEDGERPKDVAGNVEFRNINFIYPSRPEVQVLDNVNLFVPHGKTTALVGASGSGKSTIVGLAERWYDPVEGEVLLDGKNLKELNLRWLRNQISLVSQVFLPPVLSDLRNQHYLTRPFLRMSVMVSLEVNGSMNQRKENGN